VDEIEREALAFIRRNWKLLSKETQELLKSLGFDEVEAPRKQKLFRK